jgi:hypothetical protein
VKGQTGENAVRLFVRHFGLAEISRVQRSVDAKVFATLNENSVSGSGVMKAGKA